MQHLDPNDCTPVRLCGNCAWFYPCPSRGCGWGCCIKLTKDHLPAFTPDNYSGCDDFEEG